MQIIIHTAASNRGEAVQIKGQKELYRLSIEQLTPLLPESVLMALNFSKQKTFTINTSEYQFNQILINQ